MSVSFSIIKARLREWFQFDSKLCALVIYTVCYLAGILLYRASKRALSFRLLSFVHRTCKPNLPLFKHHVLNRVRSHMQCCFHSENRATEAPFDVYLREHVATATGRAHPNLANNPLRMLKNNAIVVASPRSARSRGVIILSYNYAFPLFAHRFDIERIAERYHLVLEPSWSGYCTEDILCYNLLRPTHVFVQAIEKRDSDFIHSINSNLINTPISANWWVDHRIFTFDETIQKDLDFIMVASWADFKRHHRFFAALGKLRRNGHCLRGACVGYVGQRTLADIKARAEWYGVADQIEWYESLPQSEVARLMNRAKVNIIWSRREGFNRVIIEGMFCNVPCILPEGFNYGYRYPYMNEQTGKWSSDRHLADDLLEMTHNTWPYSPRNWVIQHMTPQHATDILQRTIQDYCEKISESVPEKLVPKINGLHGMEYWDPEDTKRFVDDYAYLQGMLKNPARL